MKFLCFGRGRDDARQRRRAPRRRAERFAAMDSSHMPRRVKICDGMCKACGTHGAIEPYALAGCQAACSERGVIVTMNEIVRDAGMLAGSSSTTFRESSAACSWLRQRRVGRRGVTNGQHRQGVKGLRFKIVGITLRQVRASLFHKRSRDRAGPPDHGRTVRPRPRGPVRRVVVGIERRDELPLAISARPSLPWLWRSAALPALISSGVGGVQIGCHQVIAIPHCAMAQFGSFSATAVKIRRASS